MGKLMRNFPAMRYLTLVLITLATLASPSVSQADAPPTHYLLARPIPLTSVVQAQRGFPYGWTRNGTSPIHHGVDLLNPIGTPVLAAGDGTVFYAGSDANNVFGPYANFYGNVVVIQHDFAAPEGGAVFTLYGHMIKLTVQTGQRVKRGQQIGAVGKTGIALWYHLHFEVRVGNPQDYNAVRNPELWYAPQPGTGKVIGRMVDANGGLAMGLRYTIVTKVVVYPSWTYAEATMPSDPTYHENFVLGDLPADCYRFRVRNGEGGYAYDDQFCIAAGETKVLQIQLKLF